jgi:hypothetical protein
MRLLTVGETAAILRLKTGRVYELVRQGISQPYISDGKF